MIVQCRFALPPRLSQPESGRFSPVVRTQRGHSRVNRAAHDSVNRPFARLIRMHPSDALFNRLADRFSLVTCGFTVSLTCTPVIEDLKKVIEVLRK
jgi:hypothetical protein